MIDLQPIIPKQVFDSEAYIAFLSGLMDEAAQKLYDALTKEPPNKDVPWSSIGGFVSRKQQNYVMSGIRRGVIHTPYRRTNGLSNSWKVTKRDSKEELVRIVGTSFPTAKYVQDEEHQHKRMEIIGWPTTQKVAREVWPKAAKKIEQKANRFAVPYRIAKFFIG